MWFPACVLQAAVTASKKLEKDLASVKKSYSEACAEVERLKAILHQAASAIRASLEVCVCMYVCHQAVDTSVVLCMLAGKRE